MANVSSIVLENQFGEVSENEVLLDIELDGKKVTGAANPTNPQDYVTKAYGDANYGGGGGGSVTSVTGSSPINSSGGNDPDISIDTADTSTDGALTSADWNTFNNKVSSVSGLAPIVSSGGQTPQISIPLATTSVSGYLSAADWNVFNGKQNLLAQASASVNGYLGSGDWTTFNNKQPAGSYITALTGDITATGPGSVAATLASVVTAGSVGGSNAIPVLTIDAKGRITAKSTTTYQFASTGGIKGILEVGNNLNISSGVLSMNDVNIINALGYTPADGSNYLPLTGGTLSGDLGFSGTYHITDIPGIGINIGGAIPGYAIEMDGYIKFNNTDGSLLGTHGQIIGFDGSRNINLDSNGFDTNISSAATPILTVQGSSGHVGIGTTSPANLLSVAGIVESTTGGFQFPDATIQLTAAASTLVGQYNGTTGSGATLHGGFGFDSSSASIADRQISMTAPGTFRNLYIRTTTSQPNGGSLVCTLTKNGSATAISVSIPQFTGAGTYFDNANSFTFNEGDLIALSVTNNAGSASANIAQFSAGF